MANNGGGTWTGGQDASFLHNFDTQQHIEAGLTCIKVGRGYRREALDATAAAEMRRLALESKAKFVDAVGHLMAALTDPGLPAAHQVLLREQVILYVPALALLRLGWGVWATRHAVAVAGTRQPKLCAAAPCEHNACLVTAATPVPSASMTH